MKNIFNQINRTTLLLFLFISCFNWVFGQRRQPIVQQEQELLIQERLILDSLIRMEVQISRNDVCAISKRLKEKQASKGETLPESNLTQDNLQLFGTTAFDEVPDNVEYAALEALFNATGGATSWINKTNWLQGSTSTDFSTWFGVTVINGDVTQINLNSNGLTGGIPSEIGDLTALTELRMGSNALSGGLPAALCYLTSLEYLNLYGNGLTGYIPKKINQLSNLWYLNLASNDLTGNIPSDMGELSNLLLLNLSSNSLQGPFPSSITDMTNLSYLNFDYNNLQGTLPGEIGNLTNLGTLSLSGNQLEGEIPSTIGALTSLTYLSLHNNHFCSAIPESFGNLTNLRYLYIGQNDLYGVVPSSLSALTALTSLMVNMTNLTGDLPVYIGSFNNLQYVYLMSNKFTGQVPSELVNASSLTYLYLNDNQLSDLADLKNNPNASHLFIMISGNALDFGDIEANFSGTDLYPYLSFSYFPQKDIPVMRTLKNNILQYSVDGGGTRTHYQWQKKTGSSWTNISGAIGPVYVINDPTPADKGVYRCWITNDWVTTITMQSEEIIENLEEGENVNISHIYTAKELISDEDSFFDGMISEVSRMSSFTDGLGREVQTVIRQGSPLGFDIVQSGLYNEYGLVERKYLPYVSTSYYGGFKGDALSTDDQYINSPQFNFYQNNDKIPNDSQPFSQITYEKSPLTRIIESTGSGVDWDIYDASTRASYRCNEVSDVVRLFSFDAPNEIVKLGGTYPPQTLYVNETVDEENRKTESFIDKSGNVVLKRIYYNASDIAETYYIYDIEGDLRCIIPPEAIVHISELSNGNEKVYMDKWTYQYRFDYLKRMIEKKSPGIGAKHFVYDRWHRPVLSQNAVQQINNEWIFSKFDREGRVIQTGIYIDSRSPGDIQTSLESENSSFESRNDLIGSVQGYSNNCFPTNPQKILKVIYYDDYSFKGESHWEDWFGEYNYRPHSDYDSEPFDRVNGMMTGMKTAFLTGEAYEYFAETVIYYDDNYHEIQRISEDYRMGFADVFFKAFNFSGQLIKERCQHVNPDYETMIINKEYEYDHVGRLTKIYDQISDDPAEKILLAKYEYNELGMLIDKKLYSDDDGLSFLQSVDYRYNIRGWPISINNSTLDIDPDFNDESDDLFGMSLGYQSIDATVSPLGPTPKFNGNISAFRWNTNLPSGKIEKAYSYGYDNFEQLSSATYGEKNGSTGLFDQSLNHRSVSNLAYDLNGNIQAVKRNDNIGGTMTTVDQLDFTYDVDNPNSLIKVDDLGTTDGFEDGSSQAIEYEYDENGNLTKDLNKGITSISYNYFNRPEKIEFATGEEIDYFYDAGGMLWRKRYNDGAGNIYQTNYSLAGITTIEDPNYNISLYANTEEGRVVLNGLDYDYEYFLTDHLGNIRVIFTSRSDVLTFTASMEDSNAEEEEKYFGNIKETRQLDAIFNHTENGNESSRLNAAEGKIIGPHLALRVMPGDTVRMEVYARYIEKSKKSKDVIGTLAMAVASAYGYIPGMAETGYIGDIFNGALGSGALFSPPNDGNPKAYLNYLHFDDEFNLISFGYQNVSKAATEDHERLALEKVIDQGGYLFIYSANETSDDINVYFDDMEVIIAQGRNITAQDIVASYDYYPYGMRIANLTYEPGISLANLKMYQGKEWDDYSKVYDFHARMYDPALGRFLGVDPKGQFSSPFLGMGNNPTMTVDPDGELAWFIPVIAGAVIGGTTGGVIADKNGEDWWKGAIVGGFVGAGAGAMFSAAVGATGITTGVGTVTQGWGITTSAIQGANVNMAVSTLLQGNGLDGAWRSGLVGAAASLWTASGGIGLVKQGFGGRVGFQAIGTAGRSIGNNWASGNNPFSKVTVGVGPANLTFGKGQKLFQWQSNLGNIATNAFGLLNYGLLGGDITPNLKHLSLMYTGGVIEKFGGSFGLHSTMYQTDMLHFSAAGTVISHELHHTWSSRSDGDISLLNYLASGILGSFIGKSYSQLDNLPSDMCFLDRVWSRILKVFLNDNFYETQADSLYWFYKHNVHYGLYKQ